MSQTEISKDTVTHWGVRLPGVVRWNPGYGSGVYFPYTEVEARAEAIRSGGQLVSRQETITVETTPWEEVTSEGGHHLADSEFGNDGPLRA